MVSSKFLNLKEEYCFAPEIQARCPLPPHPSIDLRSPPNNISSSIPDQKALPRKSFRVLYQELAPQRNGGGAGFSEDPVDLFELFMEEGLFSGEGDNIAAPGSTGSSRRTSASGQFAFQPLTSRQSTPSSTDSPDAFTPFTADASVPTASTSPPFATGFRARSIGTAVLPGTGSQLKGDKGTPISQDWRSGTGGGPFTVDAGGTNKFNTGHNNNSGYTPLAGPSSYNSHQATFATNQSSSFPSQPLAWNPSTFDAQSYSGTPSPLLSQSYSSYTSFDQSSAAIPIAPSSYQNQYISPNQSLASSPQDAALLALHSSLEASQGLNNLGFAQQVLSSSQSNGRGRTKSASRNEPLSFASISPSQQTPSIFPSPSNSSFDSSRTTYQRPVPPLPRRPSGSGSFRPSSLSNTYQAAAPIASTSAAQSFYQPPTPIQGFAGIPPISRPASPRVPGVAYDFTSLEKDLDNFSSGSGGGFASAAAAAMAAVGSKNGSTNRTAGPAAAGSYAGASNGYIPPSPLLHNTDILSEPFYAKLPARTPSGSNGLGSFAPSPGELDFFGLDMGGSGGSIVPSPVNSSNSPSSSTIIDEDSAEALAKKDPIAAQVWRMFNKAKHSLPNGARMENLTWRLMSMTLKKRREETAAAEAAATILRQEEEEASEALDGVGAGRDQSGLQRRSTQLSEGEITKTFREAEGRGRKGRASASPQSASESPEGFEEDFMDWRAKSQSRSRSRAPDAAMDWRAQSRSRSRAPAFRTPMPPPETFPATAHVSRFHNDTSSSGENAAFSLAASLGLGPPANSFPGSPGFEGAKADPESTPPSFSFPSDPSSPELADPNLSAIADTLNELISLQSIATSAAGTPQAIATGGWLGSDSLAAIGTPTSQARTVEKNIVAGQNSFVDETIYGGLADPYGFLAADQASNSMSAEQQLHQLLSQSTGLGYSAPTAAASMGQQSTFSSPYLNATALAAGRNFGLHHPPASGLSLARPSHMLPETSHPPTPGHSVPQSPAYVYPSSAPVHNFINPFQNSYYGTESNLSNQQDYFSPASLASSYSSSYQAGFPQDTPTSINPTHLLSNLHTPQLYDSDPNTWGISPQSTNTHSPLNGTPSPKTTAAAVKPSLSHHTSAPVSRSGSVNAMRSNSTPDLVGLGKAASSLGGTNRNHVRSSTLGMTPANAESGLLVATTAIPKKDLVPTGAETTCLNCSTTNTPLWRRDLDGRPLCNACGLFRNLHGIDRPRTLNTGVIKKRNRQRGPKDQVPKKPLTAGRAAAARRNSGTSLPPPRSLIRAEASAPYPSAADRAGQH